MSLCKYKSYVRRVLVTSCLGVMASEIQRCVPLLSWLRLACMRSVNGRILFECIAN